MNKWNSGPKDDPEPLPDDPWLEPDDPDYDIFYGTDADEDMELGE